MAHIVYRIQRQGYPTTLSNILDVSSDKNEAIQLAKEWETHGPVSVIEISVDQELVNAVRKHAKKHSSKAVWLGVLKQSDAEIAADISLAKTPDEAISLMASYMRDLDSIRKSPN